MASKNMTTIMALYFTFNLIFLGFTSAQPQTCPSGVNLQDCLNAATNLLNPQAVAPCCTLLVSLGSLAGVCTCDVARSIIFAVPVFGGVIPGGINRVNDLANQLISLCPNVRTPPGGLICN